MITTTKKAHKRRGKNFLVFLVISKEVKNILIYENEKVKLSNN
jgi:hypothetical protein